ncbi:MAG: glycerophosphodiester phosphodiesterase family protein [Eubacteriales bacterium]
MELLLLIPGGLLLLCLLYVCLTKPGRRREKAAELVAFRYAHRGLHRGREVPENSLQAFRAACEAGYGIELDVQLSRDGVPMVFHDGTLMRLCGREDRVGALTAAELSACRLYGRADTGVPTLAEVLALVDGRVPLLVELKSGTSDITTLAEQTVRLLDDYRGFYGIESFNPYVVAWFRRHRPEVVRGQLTSRFSAWKGFKVSLRHCLIQWYLTNCITRPDFLSHDYRFRDALPFRCQRKLYRPYTMAWTVSSPQEAEACADFDTIIFEGFTPPTRTTGHEN